MAIRRRCDLRAPVLQRLRRGVASGDMELERAVWRFARGDWIGGGCTRSLVRAISMTILPLLMSPLSTGLCQIDSPTQRAGMLDATVGAVPLDAWVDAWRRATPAQRQRQADRLFRGEGEAPNAKALARCESLLHSADAVDREAACVLVRLGFETPERYRAAVIQLLNDEVPWVRLRAAATLVYFGGPAEAGISCLTDFVRGDDVDLTIAALGEPVLRGRAGGDVAVADALVEKMESHDVRIRRAAVKCLAGIDRVRSIGALRKALKDADEIVRSTAAISLVTLESIEDDVVDVLVGSCGCADDRVRQECARAFGRVGGDRAATVVPALLQLLADPEVTVRQNAASSLGQLGELGAEIPEFVEVSLAVLAGSSESKLRAAAAFALGRVGSPGSGALRVLTPLVRDADAYVRAYAIDAMRRFGSEIIVVLPELVAMLVDLDPSVRRAATELLAMGGDAATAAIEPLRARLADPSLAVRVWAAYALRQMGPAAAVSVGDLERALLEDPEAAMRVGAAQALAGIGPASRAAVLSLVTAARDRDSSVRAWSVFALGEIGVSDSAVIDVLREALSAREVVESDAAKLALDKVTYGNVESQHVGNMELQQNSAEEDISSPVHYDGVALVISDTDGAAVVELFDELAEVGGQAGSCGAAYRYRYLSRQSALSRGDGSPVVESVSMTVPVDPIVKPEADKTVLPVGRFAIRWMYVRPGLGEVSWSPEGLHLEFVSKSDFDHVDLRRFIR